MGSLFISVPEIHTSLWDNFLPLVMSIEDWCTSPPWMPFSVLAHRTSILSYLKRQLHLLFVPAPGRCWNNVEQPHPALQYLPCKAQLLTLTLRSKSAEFMQNTFLACPPPPSGSPPLASPNS